MRKIFAVFFSCMALAALSTPLVAQTDWVPYVSSEGRFSVILPFPPKVESREGKNPNSPQVMYRIASVVPGHMMAGVTYGDRPRGIPDAHQELLANRDGFARTVKGTITASRFYQYQRAPNDLLPALEFSVESEKGACHSLIIAESPRVWQVGGCGIKGADVKADIDRVMNSFKLLPKQR